MCLLVVVSRLDPTTPLVVAANRDERLDRPATAMTVLRGAGPGAPGPRILGGRDEEAGGTWLAVNEHGVVAGLTNRPSPDGRDGSKRSRGELCLALAEHPDAASAVEDFTARFDPGDYNPAWLLVGDRTSLYALDMTWTDRPHTEALPPGIHILENNPLHATSSKVDHVRALLGDAGARRGADLADRLRAVLVDHSVPGAERLAACVHTEAYGTRSSTLVRVPAPSGQLPQVLVADGAPCTSPFVDVTDLWRT